MLQKIIEFCGLNGINNSQAYLIYNTCLNLIEDHKFWDVSWGCVDGILHCTARCAKDAPLKYFIPILSSNSFTIREITHLQHTFKEKSINIAVHSADSTMLYYEVAGGLQRSEFPKVDKFCTDSYRRTHAKQILTAAHMPPGNT